MVHHDCLQGCNANVAICEAPAFSCNATSGNRTLKLCCLKQQTPFFQSHLQCCSSLGFSTFTWHSLGPGLVVSLPVLQTLLLSVPGGGARRLASTGLLPVAPPNQIWWAFCLASSRQWWYLPLAPLSPLGHPPPSFSWASLFGVPLQLCYLGWLELPGSRCCFSW